MTQTFRLARWEMEVTEEQQHDEGTATRHGYLRNVWLVLLAAAWFTNPSDGTCDDDN